MTVLISILTLIVLAAGIVVIRGLPRRRAAAVLTWGVLSFALAAGVGFLLGDVGRIYRDEGIRRVVNLTDSKLDASACEQVRHAFHSAQEHLRTGGSPNAALGIVISALSPKDP